MTRGGLRGLTLVALAGLCLAPRLAAAVPGPSDPDAGAVYVLSNQASANAVLVYARDRDGRLALQGSVPTGGIGMGSGADPLASQGALVYASGHLLAVNAGSDDVTLFRVDDQDGRLVYLDRVASGGTMPVSVAIRGGLVYVLNAGGVPSLSAFVIDRRSSRLAPLPGSTRALPGGTASAPAQVSFTPDGDGLLVTEKGTGRIDSFQLDERGYASAVTVAPSPGVVPFGFSITRRDALVVSEAASGSVSSYVLAEDGSLRLVSAAVSLGQRAPCWLVTTISGRYAFTANAGSGTLSSLRIGRDGAVTLQDASAASVTAPLDLALDAGSHFLYVRGGDGLVSGFAVGEDGTLLPIGSAPGVPSGAQGIAVR